MTDASSDGESEENLSPIRKVHRLLHSSPKPKSRRKKKMPPELKIIPAHASDSPYQSDREKKVPKSGRPRSVSMFNETIEKPKLNPASWHRFRGLPPPKHLSDIKNKNTQPSELQVKLNSLKRNVWTGVQTEEKGPLSWGISSFAMNSYFTDSEALLRSCSKKLEELEGEKKKSKDEKKKKKNKTKKTLLRVPNIVEDMIEPFSKPKSSKKKGKLKHSKSDNSAYMNNPSFTDIPTKNVQSMTQKSSPNEGRQAKSRFKKGAIVTTAIQTKKSNMKNTLILSENSDTDDSGQSLRRVKKKTRTPKPKLRKTTS